MKRRAQRSQRPDDLMSHPKKGFNRKGDAWEKLG